ncbi:UDP-Glycosyltransferase superfamily protein [Abeliophyllum distichum]|uniref:UDP-Glycosyltransferase superfamily protein n=1 Tax=Abeliophyllum distichum TaxID=126358 RepID=A0ABD1SXG0_9LAMI
MITDGFLDWTLESAQKFGIPRLVYYGMSYFSMSVSRVASQSWQLLIDLGSDNNKLFTFASVPWIEFSKKDFNPVVVDPESQDKLHSEFFLELLQATKKSYGIIVNGFYELESVYADYWNREIGPKACGLIGNKKKENQFCMWHSGHKQIKTGLEKSGVNFLWVAGKNQVEDDDGFEYQVKGRGMLVKEWVDQREILEHSSVQGFLSHCGWNSVMESICAKVPILAWPMMAEQPLNAKMVVEEIGIGLRVETSDGSTNGFVKWEKLEKVVKELMEGEMGKELRNKVKQIGGAAAEAMAEGGSSWNALNELINELHARCILPQFMLLVRRWAAWIYGWDSTRFLL